MAKKQKKSDPRAAVSKQQKRQAAERAARREQEEQVRQAENARKNARMGSVFLYAFLALIGVFCLYSLLRTLFFTTASVTELRSQLQFVSLAAIPYLIAAAAVIVRKANAGRRLEYSKRGRRAATLLYLGVLLAALLLFGFQMYRGRQDGSESPVYVATAEAAEAAGLRMTAPEEVPAFRSLLEYSQEVSLQCGQTKLLLNHHRAASGWVADRFEAQLAHSYADFPLREENAVRVYGPVEEQTQARAAVAVRSGGEITIWELEGPAAELEALLPLLPPAVQ